MIVIPSHYNGTYHERGDTPMLPRKSEVFSQKKIEAIEKKALAGAYATRAELPDGGMSGLYLIVQPSGALSWAVRYRHGNRPRKMTIGAYPLIGLAKARTAAAEALRVVSEGRDPGEEKQFAKAARAADDNQVDKVLDQFIARHVEPKNRASSAKENKRLIDVEIRPHWKSRNIQSITRREVIALLDAIVDRGSPMTANRVHAVLRKFFNWAIERDIITASPAANVKPPSAETARDRVLSNDEIRLVWLAAEKVGWPFGPMMKLLLLTGQRREEVAAAEWAEFELDGEKPHWIIPRERAKNNQGHFVPLSPAAVSVLKALPKSEEEDHSDHILTTTGKTPVSGFSKAKQTIDVAMLAIARSEALERGEDPEKVTLAPWRVHDLRRTCASGMAALGQPVHIVEAVLNHKSGQISGIAAVYNRHDYADEKRRALNAWANMLDKLINDSAPTNVMSLRATA